MKHAMIGGLLLLYAAASLVHFSHNAEFLADYPNMPASFTRGDVYAVWLAQTSLGILGYLCYRLGRPRTGLALIALYALLGFDGLAHYLLAPLAQHTAAMNLTIWLEVAAAAFLLTAVAATVRRGRR